MIKQCTDRPTDGTVSGVVYIHGVVMWRRVGGD